MQRILEIWMVSLEHIYSIFLNWLFLSKIKGRQGQSLNYDELYRENNVLKQANNTQPPFHIPAA